MRFKTDLKSFEETGFPLPDYLGLIFYPRSVRFMGEELKPSDLANIPAFVRKTGVFVNATNDSIVEKVQAFNLDAVQLHGDEPAAQLDELSGLLPDHVQVIKAFGIDESFDWKSLKDYQDYVDLFLFDTKSPNYGGTGKVFDHELLKGYSLQRPIVLSGGISLENLDDILAMEDDRISVIDMNSKLEEVPAKKNMSLVAEAIQKVRNYE